MNKNAFHYNVVKQFHDSRYTGLVNEHDLTELRALKKRIGLDSQGKQLTQNIIGWLTVINKEKYILPQFVNGEELTKHLPVRIEKSEQFIHSTNVYKFCPEGGLKTFRIPAKQTMEIRQWFDTFCDFKHSNPTHFMLYKILTLGMVCVRDYIRIATNPGFAKDGMPVVLSDLLPLDASVYTPKTAPKLMTMLEKNLLVITEIVDIDKDNMRKLEPVIRVASDFRNKYINPALTVSNTKKDYDISKLSIMFIYNELSDYRPPAISVDKSDKYFDLIFEPSTRERFLNLLFKGRIDDSQFTLYNAHEEFETNESFIRDWVMMTKYMQQQGFSEELAKKSHYVWDTPKVLGGSEENRLNRRLQIVHDMLRVYSTSQAEFNVLADEIYGAYQAYNAMLGTNNYDQKIKIEEEFIIDTGSPQRKLGVM